MLNTFLCNVLLILFLLGTMETIEDDKYGIVPTMMRLNPYYYRIYCVWLNLLLMGLGPFLLLIILNTLTLRELTISAMSVQPNTLEDRLARRKNIVLSKVSLAIVFVFIVCHSIKWIPNIYEYTKVRNESDLSTFFFSSNPLEKSCL